MKQDSFRNKAQNQNQKHSSFTLHDSNSWKGSQAFASLTFFSPLEDGCFSLSFNRLFKCRVTSHFDDRSAFTIWLADGIPTKKADGFFFFSHNNEIEIERERGREMVSHCSWLLYNAITGV